MTEGIRLKLSIDKVAVEVQEISILHSPTENHSQCSECYMPWPCRTIAIMKKHFED